MGAIQHPVKWVQCSDNGCNGHDCGSADGQIFLRQDNPPHWHVGSVNGTPYHDDCKRKLEAAAAQKEGK